VKNLRAFSRQVAEQVVFFSDPSEKCVGEILDIGLGGIRARVPRRLFEVGDIVAVAPQGGLTLDYEVRWVEPVGGGVEMGLSFPNPIAEFWQSWAAELLAGSRPTLADVVERRRQVRLECALSGFLKIRKKQLSVRVLDLGAGGALIELQDRIAENAQGLFTIKTPVRVGHVPCVLLRAWPGAPARYGVAFTNLRERHRLALVRLLDHLLRNPR
jgi:hypothetical protein